MRCLYYNFFFFFNDTATTEIYTLSLHDALPISTLLQKINALKPRYLVLSGDLTDEGKPDQWATLGGILEWNLSPGVRIVRSEEHTSELQSQSNLVCRLLLEKKK